jgi:hypothetical protein
MSRLYADENFEYPIVEELRVRVCARLACLSPTTDATDDRGTHPLVGSPTRFAPEIGVS